MKKILKEEWNYYTATFKEMKSIISKIALWILVFIVYITFMPEILEWFNK